MPGQVSVYRDPDPSPVWRTSNSVQPGIAERLAAGEPHFAYSDDCAILAHPCDRVVTTIGDVEIGPDIECRIAGPVRVLRFNRYRGESHRMVQDLSAEAAYRTRPEHHAVIGEGQWQ